jgi:glycosyltransferase involved in cell wall biosynthesis
LDCLQGLEILESGVHFRRRRSFAHPARRTQLESPHQEIFLAPALWPGRAMGALRELPIQIIVAGDDSPDSFREMAKSLGISERCRFEPSREDVLDFYAAADLYVSPTREDSFGLPIAEAMACGLPVITSMQAGVASLIRDGIDGFILRQFDDYRELALMLQRLQADEVMRKNAGDAAAKVALQWTCDRNAADLWELLRGAADRKLPSPARKV